MIKSVAKVVDLTADSGDDFTPSSESDSNYNERNFDSDAETENTEEASDSEVMRELLASIW